MYSPWSLFSAAQQLSKSTFILHPFRPEKNSLLSQEICGDHGSKSVSSQDSSPGRPLLLHTCPTFSPRYSAPGRRGCLLFPHCPEKWGGHLVNYFIFMRTKPSKIFTCKWAEILFSFLEASVSTIRMWIKSKRSGRLHRKLFWGHIYAQNVCSLQRL